jgi:hypothetical protein
VTNIVNFVTINFHLKSTVNLIDFRFYFINTKNFFILWLFYTFIQNQKEFKFFHFKIVIKMLFWLFVLITEYVIAFHKSLRNFHII